MLEDVKKQYDLSEMTLGVCGGPARNISLTTGKDVRIYSKNNSPKIDTHRVNLHLVFGSTTPNKFSSALW